MEERLVNDKGVVYSDYFNDTLWWVRPVYIKRDPPKLSNGEPYKPYGEVIQIQWGFTADMTQEGLDNLAEDAPTGYEYTTMEMDNAVELYKKLGSILRQCGKIHGSRELLKENDELRAKVVDMAYAQDNATKTAIMDSLNDY